jgi:hypothetical protein
MAPILLVWLPNILVLGLSAWFVLHAVKTFGWPGLLIKVALLIDGCFVAFVVALHQTPWAAFRNHHRHYDKASLLWAGGVWFVFYCLLIFDWPMRWLMKPLFKWPLHSGAALVFVGAFCAGKGWL